LLAQLLSLSNICGGGHFCLRSGGFYAESRARSAASQRRGARTCTNSGVPQYNSIAKQWKRGGEQMRGFCQNISVGWLVLAFLLGLFLALFLPGAATVLLIAVLAVAVVLLINLLRS
jgi:hypothetical protein